MNRLIQADYTRYRTAILGIREQVFIQEQQVPPELEVDALDPLSRHVLLFDGEKPVGTGRLAPNGHLGRIAVLKPFRGRGFGSQIVKALEAVAVQQGLKRLALDAQCHAIPFYERLGYQAVGGIFMDAGIKHRQMCKTL